MRISTLGRHGSPHAPPGSTDWSIAMHRELVVLLSRHEFDYKRLQLLVANFQKQKGWASLTDENYQPFTSFEAFCLARSPFGLGHCSADIDALIAERKDAAKRAQEAKPLKDVGRPETSLNVDNVNIKTGSGNNAEYLTARIARDNPDILERMKAGEFTSVRAAALEAGIVQRRVSVPVDVDGAARAMARHFTVEQRREIVRALVELENQDSLG